MRKNRLRLLVLASLPFVTLACFRLDADPQFDAGAFHFDAGTFDGTIPEGGSPDAQPDADAGPRPVKVVVLKGGLPESAVNVVFQDATGVVVEAKTTAADGTASRFVDPGTMVTVALGSGATRQLVTVLGVQPGDVLTALDDPRDAFRNDAVSVDMPANPPNTTFAYESHSGPCASGFSQSSPTAYSISPPDCERGGKFPVLAVASDVNAAVLGFSFKKGNVVSTDAGTAQVTTLPAWVTTLGSAVLTATNAGTTSLSLGYSEIADGIAYPSHVSVSPTSGTAMTTLRTFPGYADAVQFEVGRVTPATGSFASIAMIAKRTAAPAAAQSIDMSLMLPAMTNAVADNSAVGRPAVTLTLAGTVAGADGVVVEMSWSATGVDAGRTTGQWIIVGPPTTTMVNAPAMPSALSAWLPPSGATFDPPAALIVDSDLIPGYDQLRAAFATFPPPGSFSPFGVAVPPLPANGTVRVSVILFNPS